MMDAITAGVTYGSTLLEVDKVSLSFGELNTASYRPILKNISVKIRDVRRIGLTQGQVVGFLGPSGRGKTQLFNIMSGLKPPTSGAVYVTEKRVPVTPQLVGVVDQHYTLFKHLTVGDMLKMAARKGGHTGSAAVDRAHAILKRFQMKDRWSDYPASLSGGQRQRIAIAEQILCSQMFILMDEPFSGLDPNMKDEACDLITEVAAMNELFTIVVVTHDIVSAALVSDKLWLLGHGTEPNGETAKWSTIREEIDLVERDLAWHKGIEYTPKFTSLVREVRERFKTL